VSDAPTPPREFIPAAPGWVARFAWLHPETDAVEVDYLPVVGWAVGGEDQFDRAPLLWEPMECDLVTTREFNIDNGTIDAVFFDPDKMPGEPEIDADYVRSVAQIKQSRHAKAANGR
jgi:hypothetical protein